jgi:hypothetical protein
MDGEELPDILISPVDVNKTLSQRKKQGLCIPFSRKISGNS